MIGEARIQAGVRNDEHFRCRMAWPQKKFRVRKLAHVHAVRRLEEQPVGVDQADQRIRRFADARREAGQVVEAGLAPGVEHAVAPQRGRRALSSAPEGWRRVIAVPERCAAIFGSIGSILLTGA